VTVSWKTLDLGSVKAAIDAWCASRWAVNVTNILGAVVARSKYR